MIDNPNNNENIEIETETTEATESAGVATLVAKKKRRLPLDLPLFVWILYGIAAFSAIVMLAYTLSEDFANFYNVYPASLVRGALAWMTSPIPASLAETALMFVPFGLVGLVVFANKRFADTWRNVARFVISIVSVASIVFSIFALGFGAGYRTSSVDELLELDRNDVSAEDLKNTALILAEEINKCTPSLVKDETGASVMPYNYDIMSSKLVDAYDKVCDEYSFISRLDSRVKPVFLSEPWTYTHIAGVYTFFTGEANINTNFPDYTLPFTAAHELAHQRGIAREDEANFVAFLVCIASDDEYIRYSGYLSVYEYVANALYRADSEAYGEVRSTLEFEAREEMSAYSKFFEKYRVSVASQISGAINDTYLTLQGTAGTKSYGMVVDLAVAYYKK
jgi:hypothetical protein